MADGNIEQATKSYHDVAHLIDSLRQSSPAFGLIEVKIENMNQVLMEFEYIGSRKDFSDKNVLQIESFIATNKTEFSKDNEESFYYIYRNVNDSCMHYLSILNHYVPTILEKTQDVELAKATLRAVEYSAHEWSVPLD